MTTDSCFYDRMAGDSLELPWVMRLACLPRTFPGREIKTILVKNEELTLLILLWTYAIFLKLGME